MKVQIACKCPGKHGTDTITFADRLDSHSALVITKAMGLIESDDTGTRGAEVLATLSEYYLFYGITSWTLAGPDRKRLEVSKANVKAQLFDHPDFEKLVQAADARYESQVLLPLVKAAQAYLQPSPTDEPTSPTPSTPPKPSRRRSKPSSISTIPTEGTGTISSSLVGDSSFSPSSESAA